MYVCVGNQQLGVCVCVDVYCLCMYACVGKQQPCVCVCVVCVYMCVCVRTRGPDGYGVSPDLEKLVSVQVLAKVCSTREW